MIVSLLEVVFGFALTILILVLATIFKPVVKNAVISFLGLTGLIKESNAIIVSYVSNLLGYDVIKHTKENVRKLIEDKAIELKVPELYLKNIYLEVASDSLNIIRRFMSIGFSNRKMKTLAGDVVIENNEYIDTTIVYVVVLQRIYRLNISIRVNLDSGNCLVKIDEVEVCVKNNTGVVNHIKLSDIDLLDESKTPIIESSTDSLGKLVLDMFKSKEVKYDFKVGDVVRLNRAHLSISPEKKQKFLEQYIDMDLEITNVNSIEADAVKAFTYNCKVLGTDTNNIESFVNPDNPFPFMDLDLVPVKTYADK